MVGNLIIKCGRGIKFYGNVADFRVALIKYSSKLGFRFKYLQNGPVCIHVSCIFNLDHGCAWFVKAMPFGGNESILMYSSDLKHTCSSNLFTKPMSDMITPSLIADLMLPNVQNKAHLCAKDVVDAIKVGYGFHIPYWKANRAACIARHIVYGQHVDSYDEMFYYCKALQHNNPGSVVRFETDTATSRFKRVFVALNASIRGFKGCPPMLFVDGTFLRGRAKGTLLVAIAKDGNRGLYPFAFALVLAENTPNWVWFLKNGNECVKHESRVSYFSDRNSGLMSAFPFVFREPVHFFCLYHLLANLKSKFSSGVARNNRSGYYDLFKECAYELDKEKLESKLIQFRSLGGKKADEFLSQLPLKKWAIVHAPSISRFGEMTSNATESFNAWILAARSLPINKMFDSIRSGLGRWFVERCAASQLWSGMLVPYKQEAWNIMSSIGMKWDINVCPGGIFEVLSVPSTSVNLNLRSCSCHKWEALGFPCVHAVAVIRMVHADVATDVESYYLSSTYHASYSWDINPVCETFIIELKSKMKQPKILAPVLNNPVGRPKSKKRVLSHGEFSRSKVKPGKCMKCGINGDHDHWTCSMHE